MPEHKEKDEPLVLVATAPNEPIARMWAGMLENEGIHPLVKTQELGSAMYVPSLLSRCRIYVLASQAEKAKEILTPSLEADVTEANQTPEFKE